MSAEIIGGLFFLVALVLLAFMGGISRVAGVIMLAAIACYTYYVIKRDKKPDAEGNVKKKHEGSVKKEFMWCALLLLGVLVTGNFVVQFAVATATLAGVSQWIIGSTIVAAGTSMPETVVSIVSARKKQMGMSLGNIVGSNYFNVFWILGISAAIKPLSFSILNIWVDLIFLSLITALFYIALVRRRISRPEGLIYIIIYGFFIAYLLGAFSF